jgi:light-regulated signal transduction histidine kinase (bacteriophytochrome)
MTDYQTSSSSPVHPCDHEPIHVPGSIQPHGVLLAARPEDLTVVQAGGDSRSLLGIDPRSVRGASLRALLGEAALARMDSLLANHQPAHRPCFAFQLETNAGALDVAAHASGGLLVLELERSHLPGASQTVDAVQGMAARELHYHARRVAKA